MTQEHLSSSSLIETHITTLSGRLLSVPELQPVMSIIASNPTHAIDTYNSYLGLSLRLVNLDNSDYAAITKSQQQMNGEVGSASSVGANDLAAELATRNIHIESIVYSSFDSSSPHYEPAVDELIKRLEGGHQMKVAGKNPSDHDPGSLKVIWGHTVITGEEALLHFTIMHYLERFVSIALDDQNVPVAKQKDFFINAMTDVVILNGLKNPDDVIYKLWVAPKEQGGLGWITEDRLRSYVGL